MSKELVDDKKNSTDILEWLELLHPAETAKKGPDRIPTAMEYEDLVAEAALGYFTTAELCKRFRCSKNVMERILEHPRFEADMMQRRKELDGSDDATRTIARRKVRDNIQKIVDVIETAETQTARVKAFEQLRQTAGLGTNIAQQAGAGNGVLLNISTNLGIGEKENTGGHYVIEAKRPEKKERPENEEPKAVEKKDDDYEDLL